MSEEKLNREDGDQEDIFEDETHESNQDSGDGSEDASDNDASQDESISALEVFNRETGKNYKSWDDVKKSERERDKLFAQGKPKKESVRESQETPQNQSKVLQSLYFNANPEAESIWSDVEKEAQRLGKDPFELYESSMFLKGEAKARFEAKKAEDQTKSKVSRPSGGSPSGKDFKKMSFEDAKKLSDDDFVKWSEAHQ